MVRVMTMTIFRCFRVALRISNACILQSLTDTSRSSEAAYPKYALVSGPKCGAVPWAVSIRGPRRILVVIASVG